MGAGEGCSEREGEIKQRDKDFYVLVFAPLLSQLLFTVIFPGGRKIGLALKLVPDDGVGMRTGRVLTILLPHNGHKGRACVHQICCR